MQNKTYDLCKQKTIRYPNFRYENIVYQIRQVAQISTLEIQEQIVPNLFLKIV